jgi:hypothetical protein
MSARPQNFQAKVQASGSREEEGATFVRLQRLEERLSGGLLLGEVGLALALLLELALGLGPGLVALDGGVEGATGDEAGGHCGSWLSLSRRLGVLVEK